MKLSSQQREQIRLSILRLCLSASTAGLLLSYLRAEGFRGLEDEQLALELVYLEDKKLLTHEAKIISPENKLWRTTAEGRDYLAHQGE